MPAMRRRGDVDLGEGEKKKRGRHRTLVATYLSVELDEPLFCS